jgi:hypothetical protein
MRRNFPTINLWGYKYGKGDSDFGAIAPGGAHAKGFPAETLEYIVKKRSFNCCH